MASLIRSGDVVVDGGTTITSIVAAVRPTSAPPSGSLSETRNW